MDQGRIAERLNEEGVSSVQFLLASVLALVLFLGFANLVTVQYGRGAVRSALEQGARVGSVSGSATECEAKVGEVVEQLLGGRMSDGLEVVCAVLGDRVVASATTTFESWTFLSSDFRVSIAVETRREWDP